MFSDQIRIRYGQGEFLIRYGSDTGRGIDERPAHEKIWKKCPCKYDLRIIPEKDRRCQDLPVDRSAAVLTARLVRRMKSSASPLPIFFRREMWLALALS